MVRKIHTSLWITFITILFIKLNAEEQRNIRFRAISMGSAIPNLIHWNGTTHTPINIPSHRRSNSIQHKGTSNIHFYDKNSNEITQETPPVAQVQIDPNIQNPLLIFVSIKRPTSHLQYQIHVFDDSLATLPTGSGRFINLSSLPLLLAFGENSQDKLPLNSGESFVKVFETQSMNIRVRIANVIDSAINKAMDSRIFPTSSHRDIYFIYPIEDKGPGLVRLKILREHGTSAKRAFAPSL